MTEPMALSENQRGELLLTEYVRSISTGGGKPGAGYAAVMIPTPVTIRGRGEGTEAELGEPGVANSLTGVHGGQRSMVMLPGVAVRRLTPVERERLMGWPDGWTEWGLDEHGERVEMTDTARNRMTGNGVVSPVAAWIASRITACGQAEEPSSDTGGAAGGGPDA